MSGAAFAEWAISDQTVRETQHVAKSLGCADVFHDSQMLKECLRKKSVGEIQDAVGKIVCFSIICGIYRPFWLNTQVTIFFIYLASLMKFRSS